MKKILDLDTSNFVTALDVNEVFLSNTFLRKLENFYAKKNIRLMVIAAKALAKNITSIIEKDKIKITSAPILIIAGRGNNGGDAIELASILISKKIAVEVFRIKSLDDKYSNDYQIATQNYINLGGKFINKITTQTRYSLIVDGIFGIGFSSLRELPKSEIKIIKIINDIRKNQKIKIVAIDIASGLDSVSGRVFDDDINQAVLADYTISLIAHKVGAFMNFGPSCSGKIILDTLDVDKNYFQFYQPEKNINNKNINVGQFNSPKHWQSAIPKRNSNFHKGLAGNVFVLSGRPPMCGAGQLVSLSAISLGCGRVYWENSNCYIPEIINYLPDIKSANHLDTVVAIGPGLGQDKIAIELLIQALNSKLPLIIDADAISLISQDPRLQGILKARKTVSVLTPHPFEAAKLLNKSVDEIQNQRINSAINISRKYCVHTVLKGCGTVISLFNKSQNNFQIFVQKGNCPTLATAGSGDVLAGAIASFWAQGIASCKNSNKNNFSEKIFEQLLLMSVYIHLQAGELLAKKNARGSLASNIIKKMQKIYNIFANKEFN